MRRPWETIYIYIYVHIHPDAMKQKLLTALGVSRRFQLAIHTVFHEESESEVQNIQILQENFKAF